MDISKLELIIFDLDGTLVNSVPDLTDAINYVLNLEGDEMFGTDDVQKMVGSGMRVLVEEASKKVGSNASIDELLVDFKERYNQNMIVKTKPYQQVEETLQQLSGFRKAVLSNKLDAFTKRVIAGVGLEENFELVLGANTDIYKSKPSAEGIQYILKTLDVKPEHAMIIGDSTHDIHAGKHAGIGTCSVTYGYRSEELLRKENPDFVIDNLSELLAIVDSKSV